MPSSPDTSVKHSISYDPPIAFGAVFTVAVREDVCLTLSSPSLAIFTYLLLLRQFPYTDK